MSQVSHSLCLLPDATVISVLLVPPSLEEFKLTLRHFPSLVNGLNRVQRVKIGLPSYTLLLQVPL